MAKHRGIRLTSVVVQIPDSAALHPGYGKPNPYGKIKWEVLFYAQYNHVRFRFLHGHRDKKPLISHPTGIKTAQKNAEPLPDPLIGTVQSCVADHPAHRHEYKYPVP